MSWTVEGFEDSNARHKTFTAEAQYLVDVFSAVQDAIALECKFITVQKRGK